MNSKQLLLLAAASVCVTANFSAFADNRFAQQMSEEDIAQALVDEQLKINDPLLYNGAVYTVDRFDTRTNSNEPTFYDVDVTLKKPYSLLNIELGQDFVVINVRKGCDPLNPREEVKNFNAVSDKQNRVNVRSWRNVHPVVTGSIAAAIYGSILYTAWQIRPNYEYTITVE